MTSIVSYELGTKEKPHPILSPVKDRIKGQYYLYKGEVRYWDGNNIRNKEKLAEQGKKRYKKNKEKVAEQGKKYREENKEEIAEKGKKWYKKNKEKAVENQKNGKTKIEKKLENTNGIDVKQNLYLNSKVIYVGDFTMP